MNPKDHDVARPFCVDAFPSVHLTSSLKKYLDPSLASLFAKCCGFYLCFRFFPPPQDSLFPLTSYTQYVMEGKKEKLPVEQKLETHRGHWSSVVECEICQHLFHTAAFLVFLLCALAFLGCLSISGTQELEDSKNSHTSIWPGFHFVRNTRSGRLVFAQYFLKWLIASFSWAKIWL